MFSIINSKSVNGKIQIKRSNTHNSEHNSDVNSIRQKNNSTNNKMLFRLLNILINLKESSLQNFFIRMRDYR